MSPILVVEITYDFGLRIETGTERPLLLYIIYYSGFLTVILLFTQAPILVWFDGTIIDINTILLQCTTVVMLGYDWWLGMVINISVQYNDGFLPDIILLTQG